MVGIHDGCGHADMHNTVILEIGLMQIMRGGPRRSWFLDDLPGDWNFVNIP